MAKLSKRSRRTVNNPYPRQESPAAYWKADLKDGWTNFVALRADGKLVQRMRKDNKWSDPTWRRMSLTDVDTSRKPTSQVRKDALLAAVSERLGRSGYVRVEELP